MSSKVKNLKNYMSVQISLPDFLYNFCGIPDEKVFSMSHFDVSKLIPSLRRCSFNRIYDNPQLIYNGTIILVRDYKNKVVPYYNPLRSTNNLEFDDLPDLIKPETIKKYNDDKDIKDLPNYELGLEYKLQKNSKTSGKYKMCRMIKSEMRKRGIERPGKKRILVQKSKYLILGREE